MADERVALVTSWKITGAENASQRYGNIDLVEKARGKYQEMHERDRAAMEANGYQFTGSPWFIEDGWLLGDYLNYKIVSRLFFGPLREDGSI